MKRIAQLLVILFSLTQITGLMLITLAYSGTIDHTMSISLMIMLSGLAALGSEMMHGILKTNSFLTLAAAFAGMGIIAIEIFYITNV